MATTFFTQQLNAAGIEFSDIDSFTQSNGEAITNGKLVYLAGKYSSSVGPAFALVLNAINGNVIRDEQGNAVSLSQNYQVATDEATFDEFYTVSYTHLASDGILERMLFLTSQIHKEW